MRPASTFSIIQLSNSRAEDENGELSLVVPEKNMPAGAEIC